MKKPTKASLACVLGLLMLVFASTACQDSEAQFFGMSGSQGTATCQSVWGVSGLPGDPCHTTGSKVAAAKLASARVASVAKGVLSDAQLARLAACESGGNPRAVNSTGRYMGLFQFDQRTWNGVASSVLPEYVGVRPNQAPPEVQKAMARFLYKARGRSPWPVCGRRL